MTWRRGLVPRPFQVSRTLKPLSREAQAPADSAALRAAFAFAGGGVLKAGVGQRGSSGLVLFEDVPSTQRPNPLPEREREREREGAGRFRKIQRACLSLSPKAATARRAFAEYEGQWVLSALAAPASSGVALSAEDARTLGGQRPASRRRARSTERAHSERSQPSAAKRRDSTQHGAVSEQQLRLRTLKVTLRLPLRS